MFNWATNRLSKYLICKSMKRQQESKLDNLSLWSLEKNEQGILSVAGYSTLDLVHEYGSPLLVVNKATLYDHAQSILHSLNRYAPTSKVLYSYKTNCIPGILAEIHQCGIGAEVISPYELWLANKLRISGDNIVYNGVNKTDESIRQAIALDVLSINIDSYGEIERIYNIAKDMNKTVRVGIRLGYLAKSQFGLEIASGEALSACRRIAELASHMKMTTIHFCVTSNAKNATTHKRFALKSLDFIAEVYRETGLEIEYLDLGGGYGVPTTKNMDAKEYGLYRSFGVLPEAPDPSSCQSIDEFMSDIVSSISDRALELNIPMPKLILEPGRFITSRAEFLLSSVLDIKHKISGQQFAITDAGRLSTAFPCDFEYHQIFLADQNRKKPMNLYQIMGRICTSADWMAKNRYLPEIRQGDVLATMDAGAYFSSYSSNFAFPRPAIIMVSPDGTTILRRQETFEHLTALDALDWT